SFMSAVEATRRGRLGGIGPVPGGSVEDICPERRPGRQVFGGFQYIAAPGVADQAQLHVPVCQEAWRREYRARAIAVEARQVIVLLAVDGGEMAPDYHVTIGLNGNGAHDVVGAETGVKGRVQGSVRVQAGNAISMGIADGGERTDNHNP